MAIYGVFLAACGFEYHGPKAHIGFAPRLTPEDFKAAFTGAEGWGSYRQHRTARAQSHQIAIKSGLLRVKTLAFNLPPNAQAARLLVEHDSKTIPAQFAQKGARVEVIFPEKVVLNTDSILAVTIEFVA
jgi:hypothetical protein